MPRVRITIEVQFDSESDQRLLDLLHNRDRMPLDWMLHPENGPLHAGGEAILELTLQHAGACDRLRYSLTSMKGWYRANKMS